jgi:hypothetical protein
MSFCTAINCMDGRVQLPVINYMQERYDVPFVDMITDPGPNKILADQADEGVVGSILKRIDISVHKHKSTAIAIVGHVDCAGNPSTYEEQLVHLEKSFAFLTARYPDVQVIALWVDEEWKVSDVEF